MIAESSSTLGLTIVTLYIIASSVNLAKLQRVQNTLARVVLRKYDLITPALLHLYWLPIKYRVIFKLTALSITYKTLQSHHKHATCTISLLANTNQFVLCIRPQKTGSILTFHVLFHHLAISDILSLPLGTVNRKAFVTL